MRRDKLEGRWRETKGNENVQGEKERRENTTKGNRREKTMDKLKDARGKEAGIEGKGEKEWRVRAPE